MADVETDKTSEDDAKDQTNVEAESSKLQFEDEDENEMEVDLSLSSVSTNTSFEQESSAETEAEEDHNEVHSEDQLQKEGVPEDADLLIFVDTLLKNLGRKKEKGKVRIKWNDGCTALKDFVTLVLKYEVYNSNVVCRTVVLGSVEQTKGKTSTRLTKKMVIAQLHGGHRMGQ